MKIKNIFLIKRAMALNLGLIIGFVSCSQQHVPGTFELKPQSEGLVMGFEIGHEIVSESKAPVDILWVIDNSASMKPSQDKLKKGLKSFARTYLHNEYDIQMAVITTDVFIANSKWASYLDTKNRFNQTPRELRPEYGPEYSLLTSGKPHTSGRPLIQTNPPENSTKLATDSKSLLEAFLKNIDVGVKGIYEERAFESVQQFLQDNELSPRSDLPKLFRKNSTRLIVFLGDEDDQSLKPSYAPAGPLKLLFSGTYPNAENAKDMASASTILPEHFSTACPLSQVPIKDESGKVIRVDELPAMTFCVNKDLLLPVSDFKNSLDDYFKKLDGTTVNTEPYIVVSIVAQDLKTIETLRAANPKDVSHEVGARFLELVDMVKGSSFSMDIGIDDYSAILDKIGLVIQNRSVTKTTQKFNEFELKRRPKTPESIERAWVVKADGKQIDLKFKKENEFDQKPLQIALSKNKVRITDEELLSGLTLEDRFFIDYIPETVLTEEERVR